MDKEHLIELISNSLIYESQNLKSRESSNEIIKLFKKIKFRSVKNNV